MAMSSSKTAGQAGHVEDVTAVPLRQLVATLLAISFGTILECECSFACNRPGCARPAACHAAGSLQSLCLCTCRV